ncbi:lysine biosynthesis protein LysW [Candidatus Shapirobacteria bacterium]|nr:MAG: lysine biosynthesis protein LysW [Candidatus Shapirobacteria bacterium]
MNQNDNQNQTKIICPDCGAEIKKMENMEVGDILECQECGTEVEILSLEPLKYGELMEEK